MDPDENLKQQRALVKELLANLRTSEKAARLAELVEALDAWISSGGFLPKEWRA